MKIRSVAVTILFLLCFSSVFSQVNEGKVEFSISYNNAELPKESLELLPTHSDTWFKGDKSRFDMNLAMGMKMSTIIDHKNMFILMDMMGKKTAIKKDLSAIDDKKKQKVTLTDDRKDIAGYHCKKAIINSDNGNADIWYTSEIAGNNKWNTSFNGIDGFPMEFDLKTGQLEMHLIAEKVDPSEVDKSTFDVPSDYKFLSDEETKAMFDGMK